ncbi:hypothetical protein SDC9_105045 [bioreactor metagenome]|uniref:Uncharacterized protein n=1 Tax=bioreactor metagenome TaxID=1076179 RepID=A0A645B965_9ZZZZ
MQRVVIAKAFAAVQRRKRVGCGFGKPARRRAAIHRAARSKGGAVVCPAGAVYCACRIDYRLCGGIVIVLRQHRGVAVVGVGDTSCRRLRVRRRGVVGGLQRRNGGLCRPEGTERRVVGVRGIGVVNTGVFVLDFCPLKGGFCIVVVCLCFADVVGKAFFGFGDLLVQIGRIQRADHVPLFHRVANLYVDLFYRVLQCGGYGADLCAFYCAAGRNTVFKRGLFQGGRAHKGRSAARRGLPARKGAPAPKNAARNQ